MGVVTVKGLLELLGDEADHWDLVASAPVVTEEGLEELLGNPLVGRHPYSFKNRLKDRAEHGRGGSYGTGGDHVGRDLSNKENPPGLDDRGPDPINERQFIGYEFQGMLMFGADGKPAFHSLWPEGTPPEKRTHLKINIVSSLPDYVLDPNGTIKPALDKRRKAFGDKTVEEAFTPVDTRVVEQVRRFARNFEKTYGITLEISFDKPDDGTHISVMGFRNGDPRLNGFASFPPAMQSWPLLKPYGHKPGYMLLNTDNMAKMSDKQIHDLFAHEFGHSIGWAHPHDLAIFETLTQSGAIEMTTMSYSDLEYRPFDNMDGAELGAMDYGFRKWLHNPPVLNDGNAVYDLEAQHLRTWELNRNTVTYRAEKLLPATPILAHGGNNELRGSRGDDFIDTNTGYASRITHPDTQSAQRFVLVEGHLDRVKCVTGNNKVIACREGDQTIHTGNGTCEVQFLYPGMTGEKTLISEGKDTLVLTTSLLKRHQNMITDRDGDDLVLRMGEGSIRLCGQSVGKGFATLRVIDELGKTVFEKEVGHLAPDSFRRHGIYEAKKVAREHVPQKPDRLPESHEEPSWEERIRKQRQRGRDINDSRAAGF